jgi:hypothetical protein
MEDKFADVHFHTNVLRTSWLNIQHRIEQPQIVVGQGHIEGEYVRLKTILEAQ